MADKKTTKTKQVKLVALAGFGWGNKWFNVGDYVTTSAKRAEFLINNGLATKKN